MKLKNSVLSVRHPSLFLSAKYQYLIYLCLIFIFSGVLRLFHLGEWSFWTDEIATVFNAHHIFDTFLINFRDSLLVHPTSSVLIYYSMKIFGMGEWSARLVPALLGIASGPILYFQIRKIFNPIVGLTAALLLSISPWHLYWSQNARFYILLLLFYTIALFSFYQGLEKDKPLYIISSMLFLGLAVSERLFGILLVPVILGYLIAIPLFKFEHPIGLHWRNLAIIFIPGLIFGLFFAWEFVASPTSWIDKFGVRNSNPIGIAISFIRHIDVGILILAILGAYFLLKAKQRIGLLLLLSATIPIVIVMGASLFQFAKDRYAFISLTSWIILASYAAYSLIKRTRADVRLLATGTLCALLLIIPMTELTKYYTRSHGDRDNIKAAYQYVLEHRTESDMIVSDRAQVGFYYLRKSVKILGDTDADTAPKSWVWHNQPTWFVIAGSSIVDKRLYNWVEANTKLVYAEGATLRVYFYDPFDT